MKFSDLKIDEAMKYFTTDGAFLTAKSELGVNTMTVSWGFIGLMWGKPTFIVVVRPQRHTKKFIDGADSYTVSIPFGTMKEELTVCGTKSGADIDKSKVVTFVPARSVDTPVVDGCGAYYECKILYKNSLNEANLPDNIKSMFYKDDYHTVYMGEIVEAY